MKWCKMGLIFEPKSQFDWVVTHAYVPFAMYLGGEEYRIYFAGRNNDNKAQIGYIEVDIRNPGQILCMSRQPVLVLGEPGLFDDAAVGPAWVVRNYDRLYMYYWGWMRGHSVPYYTAIGLAMSEDGGKTFTRHSKAPILERNEVDPYSTTLACVLLESGVWKMWYTSMVDFKIENGEPMYHYLIKYAESNDGVRWDRHGIVCIGFKNREETRITRPCVRREDDRYKMWYCYATDAYRIGYAESTDGIHWVRKDDEAGIDVSNKGWDSEMICYPYVFEHKGRKYMLYNGNEYGKSGFGYAVLEKE